MKKATTTYLPVFSPSAYLCTFAVLIEPSAATLINRLAYEIIKHNSDRVKVSWTRRAKTSSVDEEPRGRYHVRVLWNLHSSGKYKYASVCHCNVSQ